MKNFMMFMVCALMAVVTAFASDEVTVKASVEAASANSKAKNECQTKAKKLAVEKFCAGLDSGMAESLVKKAVQDYKKYVDEVEAGNGDFEDGEYSCEYTITIKRDELLQWLGTEGWTAAANNKVSVELVICEDPPDKGAMKIADAFGTGADGKCFFYTRYTEFQKKIRDALVEQANAIGIQVPLLENNPAYADLLEHDPCCLGCCFDPDVQPNGDFKVTPNYLKTIQDNNPDTLALQYRIGSLVFEAEQRKVFVNISIAIKNLANNKTVQIGDGEDESPTISSKQQDRIMMEMATTVRRAANKVLSGADAGAKIMAALKTLQVKDNSPMKVVFNMTKVDKKIRTRAKVMLKKGLIAAGLTDQKSIKVAGDTLTMTVTNKNIPDMDELWVAVMEVMMSDDVGLPEATDDQKSVNGKTMTVTPGKETAGE